MVRILIIPALVVAMQFLCFGQVKSSYPSLMLKPAPVAKVFRSVLLKIKRNANAPILLPSELPSPVDESDIHGVYGEGTPDGWNISLYYRPDCDDACSVGFFSARRGGKISFPSHKSVKLTQGVKAYYLLNNCGVGSCAPPYIEWMYEGVHYTIQFNVKSKKAKQIKASLIRMANSAIASGER